MSTDTTASTTARSTGTTVSATGAPATATDTTQRVQLAIKADPGQVWEALTDGSLTPAYYVGYVAEFGQLAPGFRYRYTSGGREVITGELLEVVPGRRLVMTFDGSWAPEVAELPTSTVTFELSEPFMPMPGVTFLACVHTGLPRTEAAAHLEIGWVSILSGLKTFLETGRPLTAPPGS